MSDIAGGSLRERKKQRTREAVRAAAFRLFEENGYAATTVDQIAQAADVSARTFFRYFPNKASVLIPDHMMGPIIDLFLAAPPEVPPITAYREALTRVFGEMSTQYWREEVERQRLLYSLPEAAGALYNQYLTVIEAITCALATRLNLPADDRRLRITAGAVTGVMMAVLHGEPMSPDALDAGLRFLEDGLPL
ncbi:TetR family transcriptional regulator [Mycobacterium sp. ACS4331]|uniref:TetR family transcriptional regulator n=1 Tax=Mycobacterium sp. ACS4331 TaxID=1834121 RepID=UPI0008008242|nr:TetR family transcriptional regulator [Mycobacterium sp. ACS4331]OBF20402.1 TetR family transcriptional regulator [Mycobacterium sp. ACS4331]